MAELITMTAGGLKVPESPVIPYVEGDGVGPEIWGAASRVVDAAVASAYGRARRIEWKEVLAGRKAFEVAGSWLPEETLEAFRTHLFGIKGPLTTPVGGGIRSLNVALRQALDLYVCMRPVRHFPGAPSPVREPEKTDMVVFRENSEDIYAGIEFKHGSEECARFKALFGEHFPELMKRIRFPDTAGIGIKPVSEEGSKRLVRAAIRYALDNGRRYVTLVHKGNIMKFTEGAFRDWGYEVARDEFGAQALDGGPWQVIARAAGRPLVVKDTIADAFLEQILTRPTEHDVVATLNLNGDYLSDAAAACVGGIGIAPGANINFETGCAIFEATHGTAPDIAGQDKVNPGSLILSGELMLRQLGWTHAADVIIRAVERTIAAKTVTFDFARHMEGARVLTCSGFGEAVVDAMA